MNTANLKIISTFFQGDFSGIFSGSYAWDNFRDRCNDFLKSCPHHELFHAHSERTPAGPFQHFRTLIAIESKLDAKLARRLTSVVILRENSLIEALWLFTNGDDSELDLWVWTPKDASSNLVGFWERSIVSRKWLVNWSPFLFNSPYFLFTPLSSGL